MLEAQEEAAVAFVVTKPNKRMEGNVLACQCDE